jgi:O-antigen ligase
MQYTAKLNKLTFFSNAKLILLSAALVTIVFSKLNLNSLCIILLSAAWLFEGDLRNKINRLRNNTFFLANSLYFIVQVLGMFVGTDRQAGWKHIESQVGFFVIPLILCSSPVTIGMRKKIMMLFTLSVTIASLFCIVALTWTNINHLTLDIFFYHSLVSPIEHHAIYFSVYVFMCLLFLIYEKIPGSVYRHKVLYIIWAAYLAVLIILLSSKLVLSILLLFYVFYALWFYSRKKRLWPVLALSAFATISIAVVMTTNNPVKERFANMLQGNMDMVKQEKFTPVTPFTGLSLRLVFWRFTYEILDENDAHIFGVGPANVQTYLNKKYISMNMYMGNGHGDVGYIGYNCHNQFLQSGLGSGLIGVAVLIFWCIALFRNAYKAKSPILWGLTLTILCFLFVESVFNRQYGVILCTLLPLLYTKTSDNNPPVIHTPS